MNIFNEYERIPLSDKNMLQLVDGKANVIIYPNIIHYKTIDDVLGPYKACFILFESKVRYGHWCLLFELDSGELEFFNPYGGYPDDSLDYIPKNFRDKSNQNYPYLSMLLLKSRYPLTYNEHKFQVMVKGINTCGRWCAVRLAFRHISLEDFYKLFKDNGDEKVTFLTMFINK